MTINTRKFVSMIEKQDLARSNLYLVAFPSLSDFIQTDGIIASDESFFTQVDSIFKTSAGDVRRIYGATKDHGIRGLTNGDATESLASLLGDEDGIEAKLGMMVKNVSLPGAQYETEATHYRRDNHNVIKGKTMDSVTMTFYMSTSHVERKAMLAWFKSIFDSKRSKINYHARYAKTIEVITYNRRGGTATVTTLHKAFPSRIGPVELGWENNNEIATFEVEFVIGDFTYSDVITNADQIGKSNIGDDLYRIERDMHRKHNAGLGAIGEIGIR